MSKKTNAKTFDFSTYSLEWNSKISFTVFDIKSNQSRNNKIRTVISDLGHVKCYKFQSFLRQIHSNALEVKRTQTPNRRQYINFVEIVHKIIPFEYFGSFKNRWWFTYIVKRILAPSVNETRISIDLFDIDAIKWMEEMTEGKRWRLFLYSVHLILDHIIKPLINSFCKRVKTGNYLQETFVNRAERMSFETKSFAYLDCELAADAGLTPRGTLLFYKKPHNFPDNCRAILALHPKCKTNLKKLNRKILHNLWQKYNLNQPFYDTWKTYMRQVRGQPIYGVKMDINKAFENVFINHLIAIIRQVRWLNSDEKDFLTYHISNQMITFKGKTYKWTRGLLQGDQLSSCLCELYLCHIHKSRFHELKQLQCYFARCVDDYFFCSTRQQDIDKFVELMRRHFKVNEKKTEYFDDVNRKPLHYCGLQIDLSNGNVRHHFKLDPNRLFRTRFKFVGYQRLDNLNFFKAVMSLKSNNHFFKPIFLDTSINSEYIVLENVFNASIYLAYKFDGAVQTRKDLGEFNFNEFIHKLIYYYARICQSQIKKRKGYQLRGLITKELLMKVIGRAFVLVLKRRSRVYQQFLKGKLSFYNVYIKCFKNCKESSECTCNTSYVTHLQTCAKNKCTCNMYFKRLPKEFQRIPMKKSSNIFF